MPLINVTVWLIKSYWEWHLLPSFSPNTNQSSQVPFSSFSVPTDALANKLFGAPEPSSMARSLPATVPDSPSHRGARTPRLKDPSQMPRFYPVVKEGRPVDPKVRWSPPPQSTCARGGQFRPVMVTPSFLILQTPRKRKTRHSSNPPMECHVGWVMDSREHQSHTAAARLAFGGVGSPVILL